MVPDWAWHVGSRWSKAIMPNDTRNLFRCLVAPIGLIGVIHVVGGLAILFTGTASMVTSLTGFGIFPEAVKGLIFIAVGLLAIAARALRMSKTLENFLIAPQQMVLLVQFVGIMAALYNGVYPNGHQPIPGDYLGSVMFMLSDQLPWMMLCLSHTIEWLFADSLVKRIIAYYEAKIAAERATVMQAERLLVMQAETKFWEEMAK
jgi:hypothetical protein